MRRAATILAVWAAVQAAPGAAATLLEPEAQLLLEERFDDAELLRVEGAGQFITKLSPQAGLALASPTFTARAFYAADLLFHHGTSALTVDHRSGLEAKVRLSPRVDAQAKANLWRVSDPTSLPRQGLARVIAPILYGRVELSARADATRRLEVRGGYRLEGAQVYQGDRPVGLYHAPSLELSYGLTRRTGAGVEARLQAFSLGEDRALSSGAFATLRHQFSRTTTLLVQAGPNWYRGRDGNSGVSPRLSLELRHEQEGRELYLAAGQDLAGASGFDAALKAQYLSGVAALRLSNPWRLFAAAHAFRNGEPVGEGAGPLSPASAHGYGLGLGVEWRLEKWMSVVGSLDRFAESGADLSVPVTERNIAALRLVLRPW